MYVFHSRDYPSHGKTELCSAVWLHGRHILRGEVPARTREINVERALWEILHPSRRRQPSLSSSQLIQGMPWRMTAKI